MLMALNSLQSFQFKQAKVLALEKLKNYENIKNPYNLKFMAVKSLKPVTIKWAKVLALEKLENP